MSKHALRKHRDEPARISRVTGTEVSRAACSPNRNVSMCPACSPENYSEHMAKHATDSL